MYLHKNRPFIFMYTASFFILTASLQTYNEITIFKKEQKENYSKWNDFCLIAEHLLK